MIKPKQNKRVELAMLFAVLIGTAFAVWMLIKPELP